jgi:hypothetical protein
MVATTNQCMATTKQVNIVKKLTANNIGNLTTTSMATTKEVHKVKINAEHSISRREANLYQSLHFSHQESIPSITSAEEKQTCTSLCFLVASTSPRGQVVLPNYLHKEVVLNCET